MTIASDITTMIEQLPLIDLNEFSARDLPDNGIYLLYEAGESRRIVRVGTHKANTGLYTRIRKHTGTRNSARAWRRTSDFRYQIGGALLNERGDVRLTDWLDQKGERMPEVEEAVTWHLLKNFTLRAISVPDLEERLLLEQQLIGALSAAPLMSEDWLGLAAVNPAIRRSGLWNVSHIGSSATPNLERLSHLVAETRHSNDEPS